MSMTISVSFTPGTDINDAFREAIAKATFLNCWIEFKFNGISCHACPHGDYKKGVNEWKNARKKEETIKMAFS